jgi:anti-sigma28 factor (negative regulator of flagellin synthesis)
MSSINNVNSGSPVQKIIANPVMREVATETPATPSRAADRLELTGLTPMLQSLKTSDVRMDKVAEIRKQIENGSYDADGSKLDATIDKLLDELG